MIVGLLAFTWLAVAIDLLFPTFIPWLVRSIAGKNENLIGLALLSLPYCLGSAMAPSRICHSLLGFDARKRSAQGHLGGHRNALKLQVHRRLRSLSLLIFGYFLQEGTGQEVTQSPESS
jgi:hypothetical protein